MELTGADRRTLRRLANPLHVTVQLGSAGLTKGVVQAVDRGLRDHELVKIRIALERPERGEAAEEIARRTDAALAGTVGRVAILYRPAHEPDGRRISLPSGAEGRWSNG